jgi:hypothetical protein
VVSNDSGGDDAVRGGGERRRVAMLLVDSPVPVVMGIRSGMVGAGLGKSGTEEGVFTKKFDGGGMASL